MIQAFKKYLLSETATLVAATIIMISSFVNTYGGPLKTCLTNGNCVATLDSNLSFSSVSPALGLFLCYCLLMGINFYRLRQAVSQAEREPIGFFYSRVSPLRAGASGAAETEFSLAEVRKAADGRLIYRGVNKKVGSNEVAFCWEAHDTSVHQTSNAFRFIFRTEPSNIHGTADRLDLANLGFVDYHITKRHVEGATGTFFDYTLSGDYVERKKLDLADVTNTLQDEDKEKFAAYFSDRFAIDHKTEMVKILAKVEKAYIAGIENLEKPSI